MEPIIKQHGTAFQNYELTGDFDTLLGQLNDNILRLYRLILTHSRNIEQLDKEVKSAVVRTESAVGGYTHRGPYCPSPVADIVIGNNKRGRILKRVTSASKITQRFGFDANGLLLYAEEISVLRNRVSSTEYLIRTDDSVLGFSVTTSGELIRISEERYANGLLVSYSYGDIENTKKQPHCFQFITEDYTYDEFGLRSCEMILYDLVIKLPYLMRCEFQRTDGLLSSFTVDDLSFKQDLPDTHYPTVHEIRLKRSAKWQPAEHGYREIRNVTGDGLREPW